jgi:hypothetical protein
MVSALVWGKTLKMAKANRLLIASQPEQARMIYEQMAASSPESPYILHNLGLVFYKESQYDKAIANLSNAQKKIEGPESRANKSLQNDLANNVGYNLGNALFKQAEKTTGEQGTNAYQSALDNYKKAIIANRNDPDAKFNYELTKLRLKQMRQSQSTPKNENQNQNDQKQNHSDSSKSGSGKQDKPNNQSKGQNALSQPEKGQMTKEQAEELLKMMKSQDQSKAPVIGIHDAKPKQDW